MASIQSLPLLSLPIEIITNILELVYLNVYHQTLQSEHSPQPTGGTLFCVNLLAPIHTSSCLRAIALAHRPLWRLLAEVVVLQYTSRKSSNSLSLLQFCTRNCCNTLDQIDLRRLDFVGCTQTWKDVLETIAISAPTLKKLLLSEPFESAQFVECKCQVCESFDYLENLWDEVFRIIYRATSVSQLALGLTPSIELSEPESLSHQAATIHSRPISLTLLIREDAGVPLPVGLRQWVCAVAGRVETLVLDVMLDLNADYSREIRELVKSLINTVSSTLRTVSLGGDPYQMVADGLFSSSDHPRLMRLEMKPDRSFFYSRYRQATPRTPPVRHQLGALTSVTVHALLLPFFEAPLVEYAELILRSPADEAVVIARLQEWENLKTLLLVSQPSDRDGFVTDPRGMSVAVQGILRSLMAPICPALSTLGISGDLLKSSDQFLATGKDRGDSKTETDINDAKWTQSLIIGFDLYRLDRKRQQLSSQSSQLGSPTCVALRTIRLSSCLVDPMVWSLIIESEEDSKGRKTCHPDPFQVQARLIEGDPHGLLPRFLDTLYRLNARPRD